MTMNHRAEAFAAAFPRRKASWPHVAREQGRDVLYATWVIGADYRNKTRFYGAYPAGYLERLAALFPDVQPIDDGKLTTLHAFSGSLPPGPYVRLDLNPDREPDAVGNVYDGRAALPACRFPLIIADPPYSAEDAARYDTPTVDRRRALAGLADVAEPGGHLVWLDTVWPMHSKAQWLTVGRITIVRSTNHRVRMATIFERVA